jgi:hypothetical protein
MPKKFYEIDPTVGILGSNDECSNTTKRHEFGTTTLSIPTFSIASRSMRRFYVALSISDIQYKRHSVY